MDIAFSVFHLKGIPLWTVAIVPLVLVLAAGTLYHWWNSLHHFSEHMRHRRRVKELEAELASLKARLDELLEMPGHAEGSAPVQAADTPAAVESTIEAVEPTEAEESSMTLEPASTNGEDKNSKKNRKREALTAAAESLPLNGEEKPEPPAGA